MRIEYNLNEINTLKAMAERAESARLGPAARARVLAEARRPAPVLAWAPWAFSGQAMAVAALLLLLAMPAALLRDGEGGAAGPAGQRLDLDVRLQPDGTVVLEWTNGSSVHTVRRAHSREDLAKVNAIEVAGGRFADTAAPVSDGPEIVYYQVD